MIHLPMREEEKKFQTEALALFASQIPQPDKTTIRWCPTVDYALTESFRGLTSLFPMRQKIALGTWASPWIDLMRLGLAREGARVVDLPRKQIVDATFLESFTAKETLCFFVADDDPLTGEVFPLDLLLATAQQKKIPVIRLSHRLHFREGSQWTPQDSEIRILMDWEQKEALVVHPSRWKIASLLLGPGFDEKLKNEHLKLFSKMMTEDKAKIAQHENQREGRSRFLPEGDSRLYDRAVISTHPYESSSVRDLLIQNLNLKESQFFSTSPCVVPSRDTFRWLHNQDFSEDQLRELLVIPLELLTPEFEKAFDKAISELQVLSS